MRTTCFSLATALILLTATTPAVAANFQLIFRQATSLDGFWDFDGTTPLEDRSGNGNTLISGGASFVAPSASTNGWTPVELSSGQSALFGGGQSLTIPGSAYAGGDFSFIAAGRTTSGAFETIMGGETFRYQKISTGAHRFRSNTSPGGSSTGTAVSLDDWHLFALTYDSSSDAVTGYKLTNGGAFVGTDFTGTHNLNGGGQATFRIGLNDLSGIGGSDGWNGEMDFLGFDNSVLSAQQLQLLVDDFVLGPVGVPEPGTGLLFGVAGMAAVRVRRRMRRS